MPPDIFEELFRDPTPSTGWGRVGELAYACLIGGAAIAVVVSVLGLAAIGFHALAGSP